MLYKSETNQSNDISVANDWLDTEISLLFCLCMPVYTTLGEIVDIIKVLSISLTDAVILIHLIN